MISFDAEEKSLLPLLKDLNVSGNKSTGIPANFHVKKWRKNRKFRPQNRSFIGFLGLNYRSFVGI